MTDVIELSKDFFQEGEAEEGGLLWLPALEKYRITQKIDWLTNLSLTKANKNNGLEWSTNLEVIIHQKQLKLDKKPEYNKSQVIIKLPKGFKSSMALIINNCDWESPEQVFEEYSKASNGLELSFVQCPYIWANEPSQDKDVQWIRA